MANGSNRIPERLINFNVYSDDNTLYGVATVELPSISAMTDTVKGAGIAGEIDSPVLGHFSSMTTKLTWRTVEANAMELAKQKAHAVEIRGSQQIHDAANGTYESVAVRASMRIVPKVVTLGTFEPGASTGTEQEFEVLYIKLFVAGKEVCEIDKYNFVSKFGDADLLQTVRQDLGLN